MADLPRLALRTFQGLHPKGTAATGRIQRHLLRAVLLGRRRRTPGVTKRSFEDPNSPSRPQTAVQSVHNLHSLTSCTKGTVRQFLTETRLSTYQPIDPLAAFEATRETVEGFNCREAQQSMKVVRNRQTIQ